GLFAGKPAPTGTAPFFRLAVNLWERACRGAEPPRTAAKQPQYLRLMNKSRDHLKLYEFVSRFPCRQTSLIEFPL
ncbi:hypothetical protein, partial [Pseudomonas sp.]|uniref:hypothetical protein n=1 Tax=Pseudomonas sp. TaxID=306 RepID=UPI00289808E6